MTGKELAVTGKGACGDKEKRRTLAERRPAVTEKKSLAVANKGILECQKRGLW